MVLKLEEVNLEEDRPHLYNNVEERVEIIELIRKCKPCPFCGSKVFMKCTICKGEILPPFFIVCPKCHARGPLGLCHLKVGETITPKESNRRHVISAVRKWNKTKGIKTVSKTP